MLNKDESNAIKGLLIFLIILGHNSIFTKSIPGSFGYLYTFHVQTFFVLPFLYGAKTLALKDSFKKNFARLYYPFIVFFIVLSIVNYFLSNTIADPNKLININKGGGIFINTLLTGSYYFIDLFTGFQYLWFLPVMFSMSVLRETIERKPIIKYVVLLIGFVSYIMFFVFMYSKPYNVKINQTIMMFSLFAVLQGCGAYFLGKMCAFFVNHKYSRKTIPLFSIFFVVASVVYIIKVYSNNLSELDAWIYRFIMPVLFVNFIMLFRSMLSKCAVLKQLGKYSFPIYIIHPILCTIAFIVCNKYLIINIYWGLFIQIIVIVISYYLSILWFRIVPLRKITLPRDMKDIFNIKTSKE